MVYSSLSPMSECEIFFTVLVQIDDEVLVQLLDTAGLLVGK